MCIFTSSGDLVKNILDLTYHLSQVNTTNMINKHCLSWLEELDKGHPRRVAIS